MNPKPLSLTNFLIVPCGMICHSLEKQAFNRARMHEIAGTACEIKRFGIRNAAATL
jgi:hypothetical protein